MSSTGSAPFGPQHHVDLVHVGVGREPTAIGVGIGDGGGKADAAQVRRDPLEPGQRQRQQVAALVAGEGVDLVEDDGAKPREHREAVGIGQQQRQAFGRGQQHLRRLGPLPRLAVGRGVAGARFDPNVEPHLPDRIEEVALDVDRQRLQRRDIKGV